MEEKDNIIKVVNATVDGYNNYVMFVDKNISFKELKKEIASTAHLLIDNFKIYKEDLELKNENDNLSLEDLFPEFNEINLNILTNKSEYNKKEDMILIKINKNNICMNHLGKDKKYFCLICNKSICKECLLNCHLKHEVHENSNYIIPSEFIMNNIFIDDFIYKINLKDSNQLQRINFESKLKNIFIELHKLLNKLESKYFNIIKCYTKDLNDSENNNNENITLLRKFYVEYFTKLDNYINSNKILIDDNIYLNILNKLKDIEYFRKSYLENNLNLYKNLSNLFSPFSKHIEIVITKFKNKIEFLLNNSKSDSFDNFIDFYYVGKIIKENVDSLLFQDFDKDIFNYKDNIMERITKVGIYETPLYEKLFKESLIDIKSIINKNQFYGNPFKNTLFTIKEEVYINNLNNNINDNKLVDTNIFKNIDEININNIKKKDNSGSISNSSNNIPNNIEKSYKNDYDNNNNYIFENYQNKNETQNNINEINQELQLNKKVSNKNENYNLLNNNTQKKNQKYSSNNFEKNYENEINYKLGFSLENINEKRKKINPLKNILIFYPVFSSNNILGIDEKKDCINIEVDFNNIYDDKEEDFLINEFPEGGAYCNFNKVLYFCGGKEKIEEIGKLFFLTAFSDKKNNMIINRLDNMNYSHWNHSMIINENYIFVIGGYNSNKCEYFNLINLTWENMHNLNSKERQRPMLALYNDYLYCFMGFNYLNILDSVERINIKELPNSVWENIDINYSNKIVHNFYGAGVINRKNDLIFIGGKIGFNNTDSDFKHDIYYFDFNGNYFFNKQKSNKKNLNFIENKLHYLNNEIIGNFNTDEEGDFFSIKLSSLI